VFRTCAVITTAAEVGPFSLSWGLRFLGEIVGSGWVAVIPTDEPRLSDLDQSLRGQHS
jgi:hypothetical protein